jgi:hypothetical protein
MTEPAEGKVVPLKKPDPEPMPGKKPPDRHHTSTRPREFICGLPLHAQDPYCICTCPEFRLVEEPDGKFVFVCTICHRRHENMGAMKWVEL